jgi:hypothetical protein
MAITPGPPSRFRSPISDFSASPIIRVRPPIPAISVQPPIRVYSPIPYLTANPPIRIRSPIPDITATATVPYRSPISEITATPRYQPTLKVDPSPPLEVGKQVLFEVVLSQPTPPGWNLQYRFDFGDGTQTDWSSEPQATHTYSSPGNGYYPVHVDITSTNRGQLMSTKVIDQNVDVISVSSPTPSATETATPSSTSTATQSATVAPSPTASYTPISPTPTAAETATPFVSQHTPTSSSSSRIPWHYVVLSFFAAAALACLGYAKSKLKGPIAERPTFYAHSDWKAPQKPPQNVTINYELRFNSNVSAGRNRLGTDGATLIQQRNKQ